MIRSRRGPRRTRTSVTKRVVSVSLLSVLVFFLLSPLSALAADPRQGETVVIGPNEVINDDLYAGGGTIDIQGTVNGNVYAIGNNVTVRGPVRGEVFAAGANVIIAGEVQGGVHAAGSSVMINAPIGTDLLAAGGSVTVGSGSQVGRDAALAGGTNTIGAPVARNVWSASGDTTIAAPVGGNVAVEGPVRLAPGAAIEGSLRYVSERDAEIASGAIVGGPIERSLPTTAQQPDRGPFNIAADLVLGWIRALVGLSVLGLLLVLLFPGASSRMADRLAVSPWASFGLGFALFVAVPIAAVLVFGIGLAVGGWWLAFVVMAAYLTALALGYAVTGLFIGRWILTRAGRPDVRLAWELILGIALLLLAGLIPFVGPLVGFVAVLFGTGALVLTLAAMYSGRTPAEPPHVPSPIEVPGGAAPTPGSTAIAGQPGTG